MDEIDFHYAGDRISLRIGEDTRIKMGLNSSMDGVEVTQHPLMEFKDARCRELI